MLSDAQPQGLRRTVMFSAVAHVAVIVALSVAAEWRARPHSQPQTVLATKLVRLGKERPKDLLPRKVEPPPPPEKAVPVNVPNAQPTPEVPSAKDRVKELTKVSSALDRLRHEAREEPEGHADGVEGGEVSDVKQALLGNKFATEIYRCLQAHYSIEGIDATRVKNRKVIVVIRVKANGRFLDSTIERGSGLPAFDRATERAVKRCGGVSPPDPLIRDQVKDGVEIEFQP